MNSFKRTLFFILLGVVFSAPSSFAYLRDADLSRGEENIGVGYFPMNAQRAYYLNFCYEKPMDNISSWGMMYGRSYGETEGYENAEASFNFLWYNDYRFSTSGVFGVMWVGDQPEEMDSGKWTVSGGHMLYPELGVAMSFAPSDAFTARLNLIVGLQFGLELAFRPMNNIEVSVGAGINMFAVKYIL